ncbi:MAG: alpha/beta hydrolase, partial [Candidatus Hydrogenedentes bacterium]|nr:alpha/beta hydrolase [Candidatus Hydrogenedentota bacterium]
LSLMRGLSPDKPELEGQGGWPGVSSKVAAVVDLYGPTDLTVPIARVHPIITRAMGKSYEQAPELYALGSPIKYVTPNAPPILIFQGDVDDLVLVTQSDVLAEKLKALGLPYWYDCLYGMPHTMDILLRTNEHCPVEILEGGAR